MENNQSSVENFTAQSDSSQINQEEAMEVISVIDKEDIQNEMETNDKASSSRSGKLGDSSGSSGKDSSKANNVPHKTDLIKAGPSHIVNELTNEEITNFISKEALEHYEFSGDRHILIYDERQVEETNLQENQPEEEYSDDFYVLTKGEAQKLLREIKQTRDQLENGQFTTRAMRELNVAKKTLVTLRQYNHTVIRIHFPTGHVLQAVFKPMENIDKVKKVIKTYLDNSELNFYLYITPPKIILKDNSTLLDLKCVPTGNFYFGVPLEKCTTEECPAVVVNFLKTDVAKDLVPKSLADASALEFRKPRDSSDNTTEFDPTNIPSCSTSNLEPNQSQTKLNRPKTSSDKIPKWFKTGK